MQGAIESHEDRWSAHGGQWAERGGSWRHMVGASGLETPEALPPALLPAPALTLS